VKKIIDGKRYDTDTATHVVNLWNGHPRNDFKFEDSDLYLTKSGNWFLAGSGGPTSRWSETIGNASTYGSGITPISPADVRAILESANRTDLVERYFSSVITDA
jgi:hypothetical protein